MLFLLGILLALSCCVAWIFLGPTINTSNVRYFYIHTGDDFAAVKENLTAKGILNNTFFFTVIAKQVHYPEHVKPGKYAIPSNSNLIHLVRMLHAGTQAEVRLVINKIRTKEDFAGKIGTQFEADSTEVIRFLCSNDSLRSYQLDTNTVMTTFIPNSYLFYWNGSFRRIFDRLKKQHDYFWEGKRTKRANALGYTPIEIYTIASIVEEETNMESDKGKIASVYFNRLKKGMKLEADPTVKYAMRNFELTRILHGHLDFPSTHNTYYTKGLPPGPICTPSINTIDAVLEAPKTDYIFFVAKPDFSGYSNFAATYAEHLTYAKSYQKALDELIAKKAAH